jgi:succinoglycan biosynthesis transport protein ExoP
VELRDYVRIIRKGWILITAIALAAIAAAAAYSFVKTPEYSASAKVFVSVQSNDTVTDLVQGNTFAQNRVKSYAEIATTPKVLDPVIRQLSLPDTAAQLAARLTATAPLDTSLIQIDATSTDPAEAADLANAVSQSLASTVGELETPQAGTGASPVRITQVTDAVAPTGPESPNIPLNLALGALIGLALGLGVAVLRETLDARIRGEHDIRGLSTAPIVGGIAFDSRAPERPLIVQDDPRSIRAESFRTLRTNFQFLGGADQRRSFVVTSSVQGEGKTTTVANLAIALADAGRRVVVIDADLRRPRLADMLGLEGAVGLSDLLIGRGDFDDLVQPWGNGNLDVLPAGRIPPNPSELLGSTAMVELIARLEGRYEYVLFDAAPLLPVTDAAVLSTYVSGVLIVVASGRTRKAQLRQTVAALGNVEISPSGIVLSMLPAKGPDAYGYGYGYGYVADPTENPNWAPAVETVIPRPAEPTSAEAVGPRRSGAAVLAEPPVAAAAAAPETGARVGRPAAPKAAPRSKAEPAQPKGRKRPAGPKSAVPQAGPDREPEPGAGPTLFESEPATPGGAS